MNDGYLSVRGPVAEASWVDPSPPPERYELWGLERDALVRVGEVPLRPMGFLIWKNPRVLALSKAGSVLEFRSSVDERRKILLRAGVLRLWLALGGPPPPPLPMPTDKHTAARARRDQREGTLRAPELQAPEPVDARPGLPASGPPAPAIVSSLAARPAAVERPRPAPAPSDRDLVDPCSSCGVPGCREPSAVHRRMLEAPLVDLCPRHRLRAMGWRSEQLRLYGVRRTADEARAYVGRDRNAPRPPRENAGGSHCPVPGCEAPSLVHKPGCHPALLDLCRAHRRRARQWVGDQFRRSRRRCTPEEARHYLLRSRATLRPLTPTATPPSPLPAAAPRPSETPTGTELRAASAPAPWAHLVKTLQLLEACLGAEGLDTALEEAREESGRLRRLRAISDRAGGPDALERLLALAAAPVGDVG